MPEVWSSLIDQTLRAFLGAGVRISPVYLLATVLVAYLIFRTRRPARRFFAWLLPREVVFHPSHRTDIKLYLLNRTLAAAGVFGAVSVTTLVAATTVVLLGREGVTTPWHPVLVALLVAIVNDFCVYWIHRWHHSIPIIWPFHAVHHSAEVLTPFTVYRKHPLYDLMSQLVRSLALGLFQGLVLALLFGSVDVTVIAGVNVIYVIFHLTGSNLRHSHLWLRYGTLLEHILISPAQHQIHHSLAIQHRDKNFGEIFAVWDWLFGTLYVPSGHEEIRYGLSDQFGRAIPQPHETLSRALLVPFHDAWQSIAPTKSKSLEPSRPTVD